MRQRADEVFVRGNRLRFGRGAVGDHGVFGVLARRLAAALSRPWKPLDAALLLLALLLTVVTIEILTDPVREVPVRFPAFELVLASVLTLASVANVAFSWIQYRTARRLETLYEVGAFLAIGTLNGLLVVAGILRFDAHAGSADAAEMLALNLTPAVLATVLLIGAGRRGPRWRTTPVVIVLGPTLVVWLVLGLGQLVGAFDADGAAVKRLFTGTSEFGVLRFTFQIAIAVALLAAALLYRRRYGVTGRVAAAFLAAALLATAGSVVELAFDPELLEAHLPIELALRVIPLFALPLIGGALQMGADLRRLVDANRTIEDLNHAELAYAAVVDRRRVAREIHDGLAQDVVAARMRLAHLKAMIQEDARFGPLVAETDQALERALFQTRGALNALRAEPGDEIFLAGLLTSSVDAFSARFGVPVALDVPDLPDLPPAVAREVLLIAREALQNVGLHARASQVAVEANVMDDVLRLRVRDDGIGFAPANQPAGHYGVPGMCERADAIGGHLEIRSTPGSGTTVALSVPLEMAYSVAAGRALAREPGTLGPPDRPPRAA